MFFFKKKKIVPFSRSDFSWCIFLNFSWRWLSIGSGFVSHDLYLHGFFSASIKLPSDYTAGVVVAFYVSQNCLMFPFFFFALNLTQNYLKMEKKRGVHQSFYCFGVSVTISHDFVSLFLSLQFCSLLFWMATSIITLPPCDFPKKFFSFFPFIDECWKLFCIFSCYDGSWLSRNTTPHQGVQKASLFYVFLLISWFPHLLIVIANIFFFLCGNFFFETRKKQ